MTSTRPQLLDRVEALGHAVFETGPYNINIIGVRTSEVGFPRIGNDFDDWVHLIYKDDQDRWVDHAFRCTTDPGRFWLEHPGGVRGTAVLCPGQYRGVYRIDKHRGKYDALCQRNGTVKVFRDANRDDIIDMDFDTVEEGYWGINIHKAGENSTAVDKWSAGCTVLPNARDFDIFMSIVKRSQSLYGNSFTYTLLEE